MQVINKILDIMKDDKDHFVEFAIRDMSFTVYLDYDPGRDFEGKIIIPIQYDCLVSDTFIPDEEYRTKFNPNDYGIDYNEIILIKRIMECMKENREEIETICGECGLDKRDNRNFEKSDIAGTCRAVDNDWE